MLDEISPADIEKLPFTLTPVPETPETLPVPLRTNAPDVLSVIVAETIPPSNVNVPFDPIVIGCLIVPPSILKTAVVVPVPTLTSVVVFAIVELSIFALPETANVPPLITNVLLPVKSNVVLPESNTEPVVNVIPPLTNFIGEPEIVAPLMIDCEALVNCPSLS